MGKHINIDLDKFYSLYKKGLSDNNIAQEFGCSRKTIQRYRNKLKLSVNFWQSETTKNPQKVIDLFKQNKSIVEISKILNVSIATLIKFKKEHSIKGVYDKKMSKTDIEEAMLLAKKGYTDTEIAKKYNVSRSTIFSYRKKYSIPSLFTYDYFAKIDKELFMQLFNKKLTDLEISRRLGVSQSCVYSYRMKHNFIRESYKEAVYNPLTQNNIEILLGILMGDGSMECSCKNARFTTAHGEQQKEYTDYITAKLGNLNPSNYTTISKIDNRTGKQYKAYWCVLPANPAFNNMYNHFYNGTKKRIPIELFHNFTWQSLAYLYMDDGSKGNCGGFIATNCFTIEDLQKFKEFLYKKFSIEATIMKSHALYIKAKSFKSMKEHIKPYMCECMLYKIS